MTKRDRRLRDKHRAILSRGNPVCHLCGISIDMALKYPDPMSFVVDHVIPLAQGGDDILANKAPSHATCNWTKSSKLHAPTLFEDRLVGNFIKSSELTAWAELGMLRSATNSADVADISGWQDAILGCDDEIDDDI